jgi:hypothetical protein
MLKRLFESTRMLLLSLVAIEGISSILYVVLTEVGPGGTPATLSGPSMRFDSELGWTSVPCFHRANYFAPGVPLSIDAMGFRLDQEIATNVPPGRLRILCSGDSFTFGEGVGDDQTWCRKLESGDPRFETVNAGVSGYGIDQMYLSYLRSGRQLSYDVQLLAFIPDDLRRMQLTSLGGYEKPILHLKNDRLEAVNVPLREHSSITRWLSRKPNPLRQFRLPAMLGNLADWIVTSRSSGVIDQPTENQRAIVDKVIASLQAFNQRKNSLLVLVCLPTRAEYAYGEPSLPWRNVVAKISAERRIPFIDLIDEFNQLPITMRDGMFIWPESVHYFAVAPGHYNDQGNEYVGGMILKKLHSIPALSAKLGQVRENRERPSKKSDILAISLLGSLGKTGALRSVGQQR